MKKATFPTFLAHFSLSFYKNHNLTCFTMISKVAIPSRKRHVKIYIYARGNSYFLKKGDFPLKKTTFPMFLVHFSLSFRKGTRKFLKWPFSFYKNHNLTCFTMISTVAIPSRKHHVKIYICARENEQNISSYQQSYRKIWKISSKTRKTSSKITKNVHFTEIINHWLNSTITKTALAFHQITL